GADLTEEADSGYTPMDLAVALGHKKGHRESHPEAVPEKGEAMRQLQLFPGSPRPRPSLERDAPGIPAFPAVPWTQGHSFLRAAAFQPALGSAAP
ncbi:RFXK protein, partial [Dasyornis broadbenti]|nr:RFXK protein [Dasyornis broadbenti]